VWRRGPQALSARSAVSFGPQKGGAAAGLGSLQRGPAPSENGCSSLVCTHYRSGRRVVAFDIPYRISLRKLEYPIAMAAPRKIVSLAHIKAKDEPEPPKPRRIAHHGGAVTTNKPVALLQFLHKKKLKGETLSEDQ
jgi:hypothetical protein